MIKTGISKGKYKSFPVVKDGVNVTVHTIYYVAR